MSDLENKYWSKKLEQCDEFYEFISDRLNSHLKEYNICDDEYYSVLDPKELILVLLFGESKYTNNIIKKIDYNKNKSSLKTLLFNGFDENRITNSMRFMKKILIDIDDFYSTKLKKDIEKLLKETKNYENHMYTHDEIERFITLIDSFAYEISDLFLKIGNATDMLVGINRDKNIKNIKRDSLKKYYFNNVYGLKNNIKYFDKDSMIFGEINTVMRYFDETFDFLFGTFVGIYNIIKTHITHFDELANKNKLI